MPTDRIKFEFEIPATVYEAFEARCRSIMDQVFDEKLKAIQKEKIKHTRKETSKLLRISLPTLDKLRADGVLKSQQIGKRILFCEADIENYLNRGK